MKKIFIVGAGQMGLDIGQVMAKKGYEVVFNDMSEEILATQVGKLEKSLDKMVSKGKMTEEAKADIMAKVSTSVSLDAAADADLVIEAIKNAQLYKTPEVKKEIHGTLWLDYDTLSIKRLRSLLKKVEYNSLDEEDTELFALACVKACKNKETINEILKWGKGNITVKQLEKKSNITPYFILEICEKYGVSNYLRRELEKALIPASEILRNIKEQQTVVSIDYDKMENDVNFLQFLNTQGVRSAALTVASVLQGRLIYVECEKRWYFFNGHVWVR